VAEWPPLALCAGAAERRAWQNAQQGRLSSVSLCWALSKSCRLLAQDTDLAFAIRADGLDVLFQPLSVVYHQEGGTFGSRSELQNQLMVENKFKFFEKWKSVLQVGPMPGRHSSPS
jgi:hypothetical protein